MEEYIMDTENKTSYHLTDEEQKQLSEKLEEENQKDFERCVEEEKKEHPESGLPTMIVETKTDTNTGETVIGKEIDELDDELTDESIMSRFGSSIAAANGNVTATINDIQEYLKESNIGNISHVSLATQYELVDLLNKSANDPDRIFKMRDLPDEIQTEIQKFFGKVLAPREVSSFYNDTANDFVAGLRASATINRTLDEFNKESNKLYTETQDEIFPMLQEYEENREKALREALKNVDDDQDKKNVEDSLDAMADAYSLKLLIEAAPRIKIKHFDLEKPNKIYEDIHFKYHKDTRYNIYRLDTAVPQLSTHLFQNQLIDEADANRMKSATIFMVAFAKYCMNFKPQVIKEHTFMYYVLYNIYLLNVYHGESYNKFAPQFLKNVMEVVHKCNCKI